MAFIMTSLKRSKSGSYTARKGIPKDVRAEYKRLYGPAWEAQFRSARDMLGQQASIAQIAKATGLTRQTIYRIKDDPAGSERALASWGL